MKLIKKLNYLEFNIEYPEKKIVKLIFLENQLSYSCLSFKNGKNINSDFTPLPLDRIDFLIGELNKLSLLQWRKSYNSLKIKTSISWELILRFNDNKLLKTYNGLNEFPLPVKIKSPFHVESSSSYTPEFIILLNALNKLIGKRKFFI